MNKSKVNQLFADKVIVHLWNGESMTFPKEGSPWYIEFKDKYIEIVSNGFNPRKQGFVCRNLQTYESVKSIEVFNMEDDSND